MKEFRIIAAIVVAIILLGLAGWFWYLRVQGSSFTQLSAGRGFASSVPAFFGEKGSTFENIIEGLGFQKDTAETGAQKPPRLWKVLATPGAGLGFISGATSTRLRFLERSTGYLFEMNAENGKTERLTNTLIPQVYEAYFSSDGSPLIQQLKDGRAVTSSLSFHAASTTFGSFTQVELGDISRVVVHPKDRALLALVRDGNDEALIQSLWDGTSPTRKFSSPISTWRVHWLADNTVILAELPASGVPGNAYRLVEGGLTPLVRSVPGLTILPHGGSDALLIGADSGLLFLGLRSAAASTTVTLPLRTVPEKCVWAPGSSSIAYCAVPRTIPSSQFLNDWYQGRVHTSDTWWKVYAGQATVEPLISESESGDVDVESPVINDTGEYIAFRNAFDKSIWVLRIAE